MKYPLFILAIIIFQAACSPSQKAAKQNTVKIDSVFWRNLSDIKPEFYPVLQNPDNAVQIIYTQIDRRRNGKPQFIEHYFHVSDTQYFYPASAVKLPIAVLALQKLNELNIAGLDRRTTMITEAAFENQTSVYNDPSSADGRPSIEHYIRKIFLVSDNDAFNRLYEFLGQEYINTTLHKMGFEDVQIIHRLSIAMNEEQNRNTNPIRFFDTTGKLVYEKPAEHSNLLYEQRNTKRGVGYYSDGKLVNEPFDFSMKNKIGLESLHGILKRVFFPKAFSKKDRFKLTNDDYLFLYKYMSMLPKESRFPEYDSVNYWDNYAKYILAGSSKEKANPAMRIFNKIGQAYGYLTDVAYVVDFKNNIEFMLSATVHCNSDGIYNDDKYDYEKVGLPFLKNLGQAIYEHELKRERKRVPDLSGLKFDYSE